MTAYDLTARRRYSREEKAAIVAESLREGAVSAVARRHRVAPAQLFRWKKEFAPAARAAAPAAAEPAAKFVPAVIAPALISEITENQLGGTADLEWRTEGLRAAFAIPLDVLGYRPSTRAVQIFARRD
jgi:transposase-like protein